MPSNAAQRQRDGETRANATPTVKLWDGHKRIAVEWTGLHRVSNLRLPPRGLINSANRSPDCGLPKAIVLFICTARATVMQVLRFASTLVPWSGNDAMLSSKSTLTGEALSSTCPRPTTTGIDFTLNEWCHCMYQPHRAAHDRKYHNSIFQSATS